MFQNNVEVLNMARALAAHAAARQGVIARNVANADTPGYRAADLPDFAQVWRDGTRDASGLARISTRPPGSGDIGSHAGTVSPNGNSVSLEAEMVKAAEARQAHDMALAIYKSLSGAIRTSLGRGR